MEKLLFTKVSYNRIWFTTKGAFSKELQRRGGGEGGFKVVVLREIRLLPCKMVLIKSPGGSIGKHYKQNRGQSYSF